MWLRELYFLQWLSELNPLKNMIHFKNSTLLLNLLIWLKELFLYDSKNFSFWKKNALKNWTFFYMTQRMNLFVHESKNWTFFWTWLKDLSLLFFLKKNDLQELNPFFNMTQRIEPSFSTWLKELNLLFYMTQRIEPSFLHDSKNWTFFLHNSTTWASSIKYDLRKYDSKNWHLFFFKYDSKNWTFFFTWLNELNLLFEKQRFKELNSFF